MLGGRTSSQRFEVADEMRLIGVTACSGSRRADGSRGGLLQQFERMLEPHDPRETFWRDTDRLEKPSLQVTACDRGVAHQPVDRQLSPRGQDRSRGDANAWIDARRVQHAHEERFDVRQR